MRHLEKKRIQAEELYKEPTTLNHSPRRINSAIDKSAKEDSRASVAKKIHRYNKEMKENRELLYRVEERL